MKGFIVDRTYRIVDKQPLVYLFGRLANGESFLSISKFKPYFYIKRKDLAAAEKIGGFAGEAVEMTNMAGEPVQKVIAPTPKEVPELRKRLEKEGIACYEADIRFTQRFCMAQGIMATVDIEGKHTQGQFVDRIYEDPELTPVEYIPELVTLSLDIETSLDGKELYACTLATAKQELSLIKGKAKQAVGCATEKVMLEKIAAFIKETDPDIITGWNLIDFDLQDLRARFHREKIPFVLGRTEWESTLRIESQFLKDSSAVVSGRMVLDGIHLLKSSFVRLDDYKLETAAQHFLGEGKLLKGAGRHEEIERLYREHPDRLIEYNKKDVQLVLDILKKSQLVELTVLRSMLTGLTMERVRASIAAFDSVYIREMNRRGVVAPSGSYTERGERITGGYVMEGKPGIYEQILVLDFKSMYPSVIRTFNIDPLSFLPMRKEETTTEKLIVAPNGACFRNEQGLLPAIIQRLWEERDKAKKRKDGVASLALKTLMNSFFGVLASPNCRFFSLEMGNAITHFARKFIKLAAEKITAMDYEVIYSDTDSVFVVSGAKNVVEARRIGRTIQESVNEYYRELVATEYHRENFMELEAEKIYAKFLMPKLRGEETGAKKRYAGLLVTPEGEELDFTGLEFVRRDWTELAKQFQLEVLDRIFHGKEVTDYVRQFVGDVRDGKHDDLLIYRKSIRKGLDEYTKTTPPHVKAARMLEEQGCKVPSVVEYYITEKGPEPKELRKSPIDYDHYIEKQLQPIADSVLGFYGTSFNELLSGQRRLF